MSKLQSYTIKEVLKAFVPAFLALLLIMLLGFCVQLLNEGLDVVRLRSLPHHIANFSVPWVLPAAFLTAVIMAFGRLAADNEIIAVHVGGVHLFHIMAPVFAVALVLSAVAGYFHFETGPRARQNIERLKYQAIKQILRDRVALSAQRQFSFYPATVQYEDFSDGKMKDVLILESRYQSMPHRVITAREGSITEDAKRPGYIRFVLTDCSITELTQDGMGGRGTLHSSGIKWRIRVAPELASVGKDVEHLPFGQLMDKYDDLVRQVRRHPRRFQNPDEMEDMLDDKRDNLRVQQSGMQEALKDKRENLKRLQNVDKRTKENLIEVKEEQVRQARETLELLQENQRGYTRNLQDLRAEAEEEEENYEKITELQKKIRESNEKQKEQKQKIEEALAAIAAARRQIENISERSEMIENDIPALEHEVETIQERLDELWAARERADTQKDLRELRVRVHRRLALSVAVFVFAMIGMPLGIMTRRRSSVVAFGIGFAIMLLLFYPFLIFGQIAAEVGMLPVAPAMWSGNAVTFAIGGILMIKVFRR